MKLTTAISLLLVFVSGQDYSGFAGNFLYNGADARSIALGNGLTAGTELNTPAFYNPAGVAGGNRKLSFTHQFLSLDRRQSTASFNTPLPPVAGIGLSWVGSGVNNIDGRDLTGRHTDELSASENAFFISFGMAPIQKLKIGGTVKILQNQLPNGDSTIVGNGVGFDFGALFNFNENINFGIVIKNVNSAYQWSNKISDDLGRAYEDKYPLQVRLGSQLELKSLIFAGDIGMYFIDKDYLGMNYRLGAEYIYNQNYFFRAGVQGDKITFGLGMRYAQFDKFTSSIDYAIVIEPISSPSHILSYAINF